MADSPNPPPGSRAIKIPLSANAMSDFTSSGRPRRSERYKKTSSRTDSDADPSSLSSDQGSWSNSPMPDRRHDMLHTVKPMASPATQTISSTPAQDSKRKDKQKAGSPPSTMPVLFNPSASPLGPSMLSSSSYKSINLNSHHDDPDEPPRLITYTKHSQGFTWNDELFLPSYLLGRYGERGRKKQYDGDFGDEEHCPVAEIFVTDEEAEAMLP